MSSVIIVLVVIGVTTGACMGAFIRLSYAIRWEDRRRWSLRLDAPNASTRAARTLLGVSQSGWK